MASDKSIVIDITYITNKDSYPCKKDEKGQLFDDDSYDDDSCSYLKFRKVYK